LKAAAFDAVRRFSSLQGNRYRRRPQFVAEVFSESLAY